MADVGDISFVEALKPPGRSGRPGSPEADGCRPISALEEQVLVRDERPRARTLEQPIRGVPVAIDVAGERDVRRERRIVAPPGVRVRKGVRTGCRVMEHGQVLSHGTAVPLPGENGEIGHVVVGKVVGSQRAGGPVPSTSVALPA